MCLLLPYLGELPRTWLSVRNRYTFLVNDNTYFYVRFFILKGIKNMLRKYFRNLAAMDKNATMKSSSVNGIHFLL